MKKALAASTCSNYEQKLKGNKANTCIGNFLHSQHPRNLKKEKEKKNYQCCTQHK